MDMILKKNMDRNDDKRFSHAGTPIQGNPATSSDRVQAPVAGAGPTDCGRGQTSLSEYSAPSPTKNGEGMIAEELVGNQATPEERITGREGRSKEAKEAVDPFQRRDSIARTPPEQKKLSKVAGRCRSDSCPDIVRKTMEGNATKRKREEELDVPLPEDPQKLQEFYDLIKKIREDTDALKKEIENTYKPKKEFKNLAGSIALWVRELERSIETGAGRGLKEWLEDTGEGTREQDTQKLRMENQNLRKQIQAMAVKHKDELKKQSGSPSGVVKCNECEKLQRVQARKQILTQEETFDAFQKITEEDWRDEIFPKIPTKQGHIWEAPMEYALVLPCSKDISTNDKEIKKAIETFGGQEGLKNQNKSKGEVAAMMHSLGFPGEGEEFIHSTRSIYYPILADGGVNEVVDDKNIFKSLKMVKTKMLKRDIKKVVVPEMEGITGLVKTRMVQFLFADTNLCTVQTKR